MIGNWIAMFLILGHGINSHHPLHFSRCLNWPYTANLASCCSRLGRRSWIASASSDAPKKSKCLTERTTQIRPDTTS
jgi:hypothetical protein